jgi:hypothetical protein
MSNLAYNIRNTEITQELRIMDKPIEIEWILVSEAAGIANMHIESIRRLCRKGSIECRQLIEKASAWEVDKDSLIRYLNTDKKFGGRPSKRSVKK